MQLTTPAVRRLTFFGGADTVTGSMHRIEAGGRRLLRDAGLYQGRREESRRVNAELPFDAAEIDHLVLSHAHVDHCGNIPTLARQGFRGGISATDATVALCDVMLRDAAHIQEQDAAYLNQKTNRQGLPPVSPLYTIADAERALTLFRGHSYGAPVEVVPGARVTFIEAGHILGAALTVFDLDGGGRRPHRLGFAFDLGRRNLPLIRDPEYMSGVDTLVIESTYGARLHGPAESAADQLGEVARRVLERGGKLFVPTFALERAQEVIYHLARLRADGRIPETPVFLDSPMAAAVTRVFERSSRYLDEAFHELRERIGCVMRPPWLRFTAGVEESKAITASDRPCIVLAASGMCEHGRILHHLKHGIGNPRNGIALVGYQAAHTLGRRLADGETRVRIFGDEFERRAEVFRLDAFSAHADRDDLIAYVERVRPRRVCLVHGEADARAALADALRARGFSDILLPARGDTLDLD